MSFPSDTTNNNIVSNNWSDNLLIKDESGRLQPLKSSKGTATTALVPQQKAKTPVKQTDDDFVPVSYLGGSSQSPAKFAFHPADQEEIEMLAKSIPQDDSKKYSIEKIVERIIEKQELKLDSENQKKFTDLLYDFFRNRKQAPAVRLSLSQKILLGSKPWPADIVDAVMSVIKSIKSRIDTVGGLVVRMSEVAPAESKEDKTPEALPSAPAAKKTKQPQSTEPKSPAVPSLVKDKPDKKPEIKAPAAKPAKGFDLPSTDDIPVKVAAGKSAKPSLKKETSLPKVMRPQAQATPAKTKISDVRTPAKSAQATPAKPVLYGPVEELASLDLVNFRRMGQTAEERTEKVLDKINLLQQDSYTRKAQGIAAWRKSPIYKMYLEMGAESMTQNKQISALADEYQSQGKEALTMEEFSAISDLNKKLTF